MWEFLKGIGMLVTILGIIIAVMIVAWGLSWMIRILGFFAGVFLFFAFCTYALIEWFRYCKDQKKK